MPRRVLSWLQPLVFLGSNPITVTGAVLTTSSALTMVGFWILEIAQLRTVHPYAGIIVFLILPGVFVLGLLLMPLGVVLRRRRLRARGELPDVYPTIDLRHGLVARGLRLVAGMTVLNILILSVASYQGVRYMDSTQFCGLTCHSVMAPEYSAYLDSAHSRVACAECHIGPGAPWFVRSKLSGTRQVLATDPFPGEAPAARP
jgi:NapC/NirT cytochrome c family, N-terminal region